jgi:uncharacterized protein (DUF1800 family)
VQTAGYKAWLDQQFNAPSAISGWDWLISRGLNGSNQNGNFFPINYMAWHQLIMSGDAVRKRVALALSEIFVVAAENVQGAERPLFLLAAYWDMLSSNAFGTYRQLLEAVTLNPAMGYFLNTRGNQKANPSTGRAPDENFGREVMQLFSIGLHELNQDGSLKTDGNGQPIETYNQSTVTAMASVFTGWDYDYTQGHTQENPVQVRLPMKLNAALHSTTTASFLGTTVAAGTDGATALKVALDTLANHPNVAPFIGRQLIQRLVTSNPSPAYIGRVSAVWNNNGSGVRGDMKAVIRAILLDDEARSGSIAAGPTWGKLREPMVRFIQWARTFNASSPSGEWTLGDLNSSSWALGQSPFYSSSVFNFFRPGYVPPDTALAATGQVAPEFQITNESTVASYINFMADTVRKGFVQLVPNYSKELSIAADAAALVDRVNLLMSGRQLSTATLNTIVTAVSSISAGSADGLKNRVYAAILLVMASPQYIVQK